MKIPVAVFSYNRPGHTQKALEALSQCNGLEHCQIYLFSDAPREPAQTARVEETRTVLRHWADRLGATLVERSENLGLSKSIVSGVSSLCDEYGRVIVLEDDLIVGPDFLTYMVSALERYADEAQVMQIGGCTLASPSPLARDAFFLPVTTTWGWATWGRAWRQFSWVPADLEAARTEPQWLEIFNLHGTYNYLQMLDDRLAGRNDSWGILWWYAVSRQGGLVLYPKTNLVQNIGFDGSGIHCGAGDFDTELAASAPDNARELAWPDGIAYEPAHLARLEAFLAPPQSSVAAAHPPSRLLQFCKTTLSRLTKMA
ncbi:glycosyltransferase family 2 protein [Nodosilinea sp. PGN35]|uniref:glycosyltransferase family 2 protein n=1 Tax=Nodosilinea sp. PGN35 TaxID=3020489 RepID=UPI0023B26242|nr:hypothetical protein [Nodosilinea sp. TSF1-S3]MDF0367602.1 hypothetical protein [Nodosilinea sp. TSF1-S3]